MEILKCEGLTKVYGIGDNLMIAFVLYATSASHIKPMEFVDNMPLIPLLIFVGMIMGSVALAYYIGGRKLYRNNMIENLKNDIQF